MRQRRQRALDISSAAPDWLDVVAGRGPPMGSAAQLHTASNGANSVNQVVASVGRIFGLVAHADVAA